MAGRRPGRKTSETFQQGRMPASPLGATPRPPLRQVYPKVAFLSESQMNTSTEGDYSEVRKSSKTSYTLLRSSRNGTDAIDNTVVDDYLPEPADIGSSTKSIIILSIIFFLSLVALAWMYQSKE